MNKYAIIAIMINSIFYFLALSLADCIYLGGKEMYFCGLKYNVSNNFIFTVLILILANIILLISCHYFKIYSYVKMSITVFVAIFLEIFILGYLNGLINLIASV